MILQELMIELEALGSEQTKNIYYNHGAQGEVFGVKVGDLKKLVKYVKKNQALALELFETGNHDAMYLAGLAVNPKEMTKEQLQVWVEKASWYMQSEYTVASVTAESPYAMELAREWIHSSDEQIATAGWSVYANYLSITDDSLLDKEELRRLLHHVKETIHEEKNRVRYVMNGFVISVGCYVKELHEEAMEVAGHIGKVYVDVGQTACKVPLATEYIQKVETRGKLGVKRKTCIC
ncbi:3-methyladenine DNA glycosylase AlkD [Bacillus tianshenii]|uniref:3-methyladenine DNA glycosylase AlkD n=1 Tax=Sutcliffiella tianshenii TaxID=1463404 RepID=A0ABS2P223_9BACI|nr:DNA alkylation repair protein [Bacillus tianshenii]MBM7620931.1 3-methyladenine DNA glycosylase AlkD [Bacillus tianshenii]